MLAKLGLTPQKPLKRAYQRDAQAIERWKREDYPGIAKQAKARQAEIAFWDESGFRADTVQGRTWGLKGRTPEVKVPGQRQSVSAASAVNARGAFWFVTHQGALNAALFVEFLKQLMKHRKKPLELVLDSLPGHKGPLVRAYVESLNGKLRLHYLPGYAPELNPDELVWNHAKVNSYSNVSKPTYAPYSKTQSSSVRSSRHQVSLKSSNTLSGLDRIGDKHRNGHRADASRNRGDE